jgi:predicted RND superfamily exporter protein
MEKTLKLGDKDYRLHSSLFTIIDYRNVFSTELFSDIRKLEKSNIKQEEDLSSVIDTIFRIIYILNRPFSKESYNDFLMSLDFSLLSNQNELENLTNAIGEMLGTFQKRPTTKPPAKK